MSRYKKKMGVSVLEAARERIHHTYDTHDSPIVLFSGGKDSQVLLHLAWEVAQERGLNFVNAVFIHEEFSLNPTIDLVRHYAEMPWVRMHHFCIPTLGMRVVFDRTVEYRHWDKKRENLRPLPDYAIRPTDELWETPWWLEDVERFQCQFFPGKVAQMNGMRASESRFRLNGAMCKLSENFITKGNGYARATLVKPLYDWLDNDILKYLYDNKIPYCKVYDFQMFCRMKLRTSSQLHPENMQLDKLRQIDPVFYDQLLKIFPQQVVHEKYAPERNDAAIYAKYGQSIDTIEQYIVDHYTEGVSRNTAIYRLYEIYKMKKGDANAKCDTDKYPLKQVLRYFIKGTVWKPFVPFAEKN